EWLGLEPATSVRAKRASPADAGWRMSRLDDLTLYAGTAQKVIALVVRDQRLMRLDLTLPPALTTWRLAVRDAALVEQWLEAKS
ncbi:MAG: M61 family metallopeptidase, partial [Polaromonas sp.]